jgi:predicted Zn-ribbon and HTH transcriptional regulator
MKTSSCNNCGEEFDNEAELDNLTQCVVCGHPKGEERTLPKVHAPMWCYNCEHEWKTDDYLITSKCPNCTQVPVKIYNMYNFSFAYAHIRKHPEQYSPHITGEKCVEHCDHPRCSEPGCIRKI